MKLSALTFEHRGRCFGPIVRRSGLIEIEANGDRSHEEHCDCYFGNTHRVISRVAAANPVNGWITAESSTGWMALHARG